MGRGRQLLCSASHQRHIGERVCGLHHTAVLRRVSHQCKCQRSSGDSNIHCNCAVSDVLKTRISTSSSTANAASGCGHPGLDPCYWTELATEEKTLFALLLNSLMVQTT